MADVCEICGGLGLRVVERADGVRVAQACVCRAEKKAARMIEAARIPQRYANCTLDNFDTKFSSADKSLRSALVQASNFVKAYPLETDGKGLLLVGDVGLGKTHLAVGLLQALVREKGAKGIFCDYRDLLKQIQNSYGRSDLSERDILAPVFEADVLVLDELGAAKPTDWVWDTVQHILNTRYNDRRTTIITTNYPNDRESPPNLYDNLSRDKASAKKAMHEDTLGDRITERMRSRLQEMCVVVEMQGEDFRQKVKRASFRSSQQSQGMPLSAAGESEDALRGAGVRETLMKEAEDRFFGEKSGTKISERIKTPAKDDGEGVYNSRSIAKYRT
jgi:DNA replication protein DnaC